MANLTLLQAVNDGLKTAMRDPLYVNEAMPILKLLERFRAARPDLALSGDFIVGFPGETDAEFEETLALVDEVKYAQAFSFKYSPRPGTPAATMDGQVSKEVMDERLQFPIVENFEGGHRRPGDTVEQNPLQVIVGRFVFGPGRRFEFEQAHPVITGIGVQEGGRRTGPVPVDPMTMDAVLTIQTPLTALRIVAPGRAGRPLYLAQFEEPLGRLR